MIYLILSLVFVFIYTHALIYLSKRYAEQHLMQAPHLRGTHTRTIPRGVGLSVVITCLIALAALAFNQAYFPTPVAIAIIVGGTLVGLIGFLDDHSHIAPSIRLLVQSLSVGIVLYQIGGFPEIYILDQMIYLGWFGHILAFLGMVWLLNLYNFNDGIDGYVAMETVFISLTLAVMVYLLGFLSLTWFLLVLAVSMSAFLCWNWQPAKVFMGDVCSGFLGFLWASLMAYTAKDNWVPIITWFILLAIPIIDATVTLIVRLAKGYSYGESHNSHAYHHAVVRYGSHQAVVLRALAINLFWLLPLATASFLWPQYDLYFFVVAVAPIFYIVIKLGAGQDNDFSKFLAPRDRFELPTK